MLKSLNSEIHKELDSHSQPRWHLIYYLLAGFDLIVILFSLFLNHQLTGIYNNSVQINQQWSDRLGNYAELSQLASAVNAPGNDLFDSSNVEQESARLEAALKLFYTAIDAARDDLNKNVLPEERSVLSEDITEITSAMEGMKGEAYLIFSYFNMNETRKAGERMATMDRQYAKVNSALAKLNRHVQKIQSAHLDQQMLQAQSLARFEYVIFAIVILIIGGVIAYGRKLSTQIRISQQEKDEHLAALQASEGSFKSLSEASPVGIFQADARGYFFYINERLQELSGLTSEESFGEGWKQAIHPDDFHIVSKEWANSLGEGKPFSYEFRLVTPDKKVQWIYSRCNPLLSDFGKVIGYVGTVEDISERKRTEEALRESEEHMRMILDIALDAVITIDSSGLVTKWNKQAEKIFGWSNEEAIGQTLSSLIIPHKHREAHQQGIKDYFTTGRDHVLNRRIEITALRRNGEEFPVELAIAPVWSHSGVRFSAFIRNITDRKEAEVQLHEAKESAESANRAKSEFLANMSHEIRTPMNAVIGMTGLLLDTELSAEQQEFAEVIRTSSDTLLTIINDILDFSKIESGKLDLERHPFDLRDAIEESLDLLATKASEKNLNLAYTIDSQVPGALVGDSTRLRQIFVNLINNAVKFTHVGEIVVSVSARIILQEEKFGALPSGHQSSQSTSSLYELHCVVEDTGIGIPEDKINTLFRSFSQVDTSTTRIFGGTGLGLVISKRLAEMMGGTMWIESEMGKGSRFHFTIKATAAPSQIRIYLRSSQPELKGRRLLIVDDNSTNRRILELQAESWGMKPCVASSGQQALEWISRGDPFDVAILDMHMPEMDGLQLAAEIRRLYKPLDLPMIMLTSIGKRSKEDSEGNFSVFLTKPIKPSQLYDALIGVFAGKPSRVLKSTITKQGFRAPRQLNTLKILLVEDSVVNQKVALRILERMGYRADVAGNGLEAIQALERQHYDVALMDVQMPEMDGLAATREICRRWSRAERPRIIAMTANAMQGDNEECLAAGMDDYISKPVHVGELVAALERSSQLMTISEDISESDKGEEAIDLSIIESLFGNDTEECREAIGRLVHIYIEDAGKQLSEMEKTIHLQDAHETRQLAHALKGGSAALNAKRMADLSDEMEKIARQGSLDGAAELLDRMKIEFERVRQTLESRELFRN